MNSSRMVKIILKWKPVWKRQTGRPSVRWLDDVCRDTKVMKVKNRKELALNGNPGVCLVEKQNKGQFTQRYVAFQTAVFLNML
jgi:hypothetical protein